MVGLLTARILRLCVVDFLKDITLHTRASAATSGYMRGTAFQSTGAGMPGIRRLYRRCSTHCRTCRTICLLCVVTNGTVDNKSSHRMDACFARLIRDPEPGARRRDS